MKAILLLALIFAVACVEPEDAVVTIDVELLQSAVARGVNIMRYVPVLSELYQKERFDDFTTVTANLIENTFTAVTNLVEAITYNPENMEKTLQGNWNFNIGGFNLPCINICLNWGSGSYGCNCS